MAGAKTILVTGATGQQGGAVARCLLSKGQTVRVLTRSPEKARELETQGADIVRGDFENKESIMEAVRGVDGVFLMGTPFEKGVTAEIEQGKAVVIACWKTGVSHLVYSSVCGANLSTGIPYFDSKARVETCINETEQPCTVLRPAFFMENFNSPWLLPSIEKGVLSTPILPDTKLQMICLDDVGEFAAQAFLRPEEFLGAEIDLAGDELPMQEICLQISCCMNREVRYEPVPDDRAESAVGHDFALMYRWLNRQRHQVDIDELRSRWRIPLTSFSRFLGRSELYRRAA